MPKQSIKTYSFLRTTSAVAKTPPRWHCSAAVRKHLATRNQPQQKTNRLTDIFIHLNLLQRITLPLPQWGKRCREFFVGVLAVAKMPRFPFSGSTGTAIDRKI